jgi:LysM repeat protein
MHREPRHSPARIIAPLALAVCTVAFLFILFSSGTTNNNSNNGQRASETTSTSQRSKPSRRRSARKTTYTVKTGDTLGGIAAKTGLTVEKLQELNPQLDPQALVSGQKIKLRE